MGLSAISLSAVHLLYVCMSVCVCVHVRTCLSRCMVFTRVNLCHFATQLVAAVTFILLKRRRLISQK